MILPILDELAATSSRNEKIAIMRREKDNVVLQQVISAALDPYINYWIKTIPEYSRLPESISFSTALKSLTVLSQRKVTGNAAISYLANILGALEPDEAEVIERIISRDLRCGIATSPNEVWPGIIPSFDVMLCDKDITRITYPAYSQKKSDGARVHMYYDGTCVTAFTRSGKEIPLFGVFDSSASLMMKPGETWDGELVVCKDDVIIDRKTGNGIITKCLKGKGTKEIVEDFRMVCWDIVDFTSTIPYKQRLETLEARFDAASQQKVNTKFLLVENRIVHSLDQAMEHFDEMIAQGEEGTILKNINHVWEPKRSKHLCKLKAEEDVTLEVVGKEEGTGKNVGRLGALICQSRDGGIKVKVGTGFSDEQRDEFWITTPTFVDVTYNQIVCDKKTKQKSLFLPRFLKDRSSDKTEADIL